MKKVKEKKLKNSSCGQLEWLKHVLNNPDAYIRAHQEIDVKEYNKVTYIKFK